MFDHGNFSDSERRRHRDVRGDMARHLREELRRNLRHGGGHRPPINFRDILNDARTGPSMRRGEIRPLILDALREKPMHGYEVIQKLEEQSGGRWRPSAGSVYPTLQQLADEGLVTSEEVDGRRTYTLTDAGKDAASDAAPRARWAANDDREPDVMRLAMQLAAAVVQVQKMGSPRARTEATRVLTDARKQMYRLLSEDEDASTDDSASTGDDATPA